MAEAPKRDERHPPGAALAKAGSGGGLYLLDTVALAHYLAGELPAESRKLFDTAEKGGVRLLLPQAVVGEFLTLCLKGHLKVRHPRVVLEQLVKEMEVTSVFTPVEPNAETWRLFLHLKVPEQMNRLLVAVATAYGAEAIVTNNPRIRKFYKTVW